MLLIDAQIVIYAMPLLYTSFGIREAVLWHPRAASF